MLPGVILLKRPFGRREVALVAPEKAARKSLRTDHDPFRRVVDYDFLDAHTHSASLYGELPPS